MEVFSKVLFIWFTSSLDEETCLVIVVAVGEGVGVGDELGVGLGVGVGVGVGDGLGVGVGVGDDTTIPALARISLSVNFIMFVPRASLI